MTESREYAMTNEQLREILILKKENISKAFRDKVTYWDGESSVWVYNMLTSIITKIDDKETIKMALLTGIHPYVKFFSNKENADTYKFVHDLIESEIDDALLKSWGDPFAFMNVKNISGDTYASNYVQLCEGVMNEYREQTKYSRIDRPSKNSICN